MNLYKSVTVIIGDPSSDSRTFQSKYKEYGITHEYWKTEIKSLVDIRNSSDIAHYQISREKLNELQNSLPSIFGIAIHVMNQYIEFLES